MKGWLRRDVLKSGMALPTAAALGLPEESPAQSGSPAESNAGSRPLRERSLLDFGWRFHFGHANEAAEDFGFGSGRSGGFQKTGGFLAPSSLAFDDSD
jgi:beta-galactosidase